MSRLLLALAIAALTAATALAHGGRYVPPTARFLQHAETEDPLADNDPTPSRLPTRAVAARRPRTTAGGAPLLPAAGPAAAGERPAAPARRGRRPDVDAGGRRSGGPSLTYDSWEFWWSYNDDDILDLRARLGRATPCRTGLIPSGSARATGEARRHPTHPPRWPSAGVMPRSSGHRLDLTSTSDPGRAPAAKIGPPARPPGSRRRLAARRAPPPGGRSTSRWRSPPRSAWRAGLPRRGRPRRARRDAA